jgi:hypothetical protein
VVLARGRVAEIGRHDDLLARGGVYAKLYDLQIFGGRKDLPAHLRVAGGGPGERRSPLGHPR